MNIYLDCGFYVGNALKQYMERGEVDASWAIHAFEPNPDIEIDNPLVILHREAVWTDDGEVTFVIAGRHDAASIKDTSGHEVGSREVTVKSIDFSKFVKELPKGDVICSCDIEGAEFLVLEKMLEEDTIDRIKILDIEFHHRLMTDKTEEDSQKLINEIEKRGVEVRLKVPLI